MKTRFITLAALAALFSLTGCVSIQKELAKVLEPGDYKKLNVTVTGKFTGTTATANNVTVTPEGKIKPRAGGSITITHSNPWVPLIQIVEEAEDAK